MRHGRSLVGLRLSCGARSVRGSVAAALRAVLGAGARLAASGCTLALAFGAFAAEPAERSAEAWLAALGSADAGARREAVNALGSAPAPATEVLAGVAALLAAPEAPVRAAALDVFQALGPDAQPAVPALLAAFDAGGSGFAPRTGVTRALGAIGAPAALPRFRAALAEVGLGPASARYRAALVAAISAEAGSDDPSLSEHAGLLARGLRSRAVGMRVEAARSLAAMGAAAQPAVPALRETLARDEERAVRALAAEALGAIGPGAREALPELRAAQARDPNARVRSKATQALRTIERGS